MSRISFMITAAAVAAITVATPALAGSADGKLQIKMLGSGVLPDGKIENIKSIDTGTTLGGALVGADVQTRANDNFVPTLAFEYFFSPNVSIETICCLTQHHVTGTDDIDGAGVVDHVLILPATLTAKYHLPLGGGFKPYVGAGPSLFIIFDEKPGDTVKALGIDKLKMSNELGFVLQGGFDLPINANGLGLSVDAKKYWMNSTVKFYEGDLLALETKHKLDPWVVSAGVSYRF